MASPGYTERCNVEERQSQRQLQSLMRQT